MGEYSVITVAWQYGSGGEKIAAHLAARLGVPCYAEVGGEKTEPSLQTSGREQGEWLYLLSTGTENGVSANILPPLPAGEDRFFASCERIRHMAARGPCVIASDLGEFVLRAQKDRVSIFICADRQYRRRAVEQEEALSAAEALGRLEKADRRQRSTYGFYTGERWDVLDRYSLCISASAMEEADAVALIEGMIRRGDKRE